MIFQVLAIASLVPATATALYYTGLAVHALMVRRSKEMPSAGELPRTRFVIVIPAHDEAATLPGTLRSCAALDYPQDLHRIWVIADNCHDATADVARQHGARALERQDPENRGKGFALEWAFERVQEQDFDAAVVIDADCSLDPQSLRVFDERIRRGERVIQATDEVSNPDESPMSYALAVGNHIENELFYAPKSELGLAVFLRGTGMVLHRQVLDAVPWRARSVAEDVEYGLQLLESGFRVTFEPRVSVSSRFPVGREQVDPQRQRWAAGNFALSRTRAWRLLSRGVRRRQLLLVDAGWTLLVLSRPLVLVQLLFTVMLAGLAVWLEPVVLSRALLALAITAGLMQAGYFLCGILHLGLSRRRLRLLLETPWTIGRLVFISVAALAGPSRRAWQKTPRT